MIENKHLDFLNPEIDFLKKLKSYNNQELIKLSAQIREFLLNTVSATGGHLAANLGVVELSIALHKVFNSPKDRIIWDIGHQSYVHKILTQRANKLHTIRQKDGLSGFTNIFESKHDHFGAGHSSTSLSALLGFIVSDKLASQNDRFNTAVIGDSSIVSGMAFEAMNMLSSIEKKCLVVLNDNNMSISKPVGSISSYLTKISASNEFLSIRNNSKKILDKTPLGKLSAPLKKLEYIARTSGKGALFEELGFYYIGPIDGHKFDDLIPMLLQIKQMDINKPILLHIKTQKGKGYKFAEEQCEKYHGVDKFNLKDGVQNKNQDSYTATFGNLLVKNAKQDKKIVSITPAMITGSGLSEFFKQFKERAFDVGIAEQNAATFAGALAQGGFKVFLSLYSTFSQRAYDQIVHDIALQKLPVKIILDRVGFVGADGATHHGVLDLNMFTSLPNTVILSPTCSKSMQDAIATCLNYNDGPSVLRLSKGKCDSTSKESYQGKVLELGKWKDLTQGSKVAIIATGDIFKQAQKACEMIFKELNFTPTLVNAIFTKPVDSSLLKDLSKTHDAIVTVEEGYLGGFSTLVNDCLLQNNCDVKIKNLALRDSFFEQNTRQNQQELALVDYNAIFNTVKELIS